MKYIEKLKPSDQEIKELAYEEIQNYNNFKAINKGSFINLFLLVIIGFLSVPLLILRVFYILFLRKKDA
jgi:hypothetical protein